MATSSLSEEHRAKLDQIVSKMEANGESVEDIKFVVNDFKAKYAGQSAGQPSDGGKALASTASGIVTPDAIRERPNGPAGLTKRLWDDTMQGLKPPMSMEDAKRFLKPNPGSFGPNRFGRDVIAYGNEDFDKAKENFTESGFAQNNPVSAAAIRAGASTFHALTSMSPDDMPYAAVMGGMVPPEVMGNPVMQNLSRGAVPHIIEGGLAAAKKLGEASAPLVQRAKDIGLKLTPAEIMNSKPVALIESVLEKTPFSAGMIQKFRVKQAAALDAAAQNLVNDLGTVMSREDIGSKALGDIDTKAFARLRVRDKLFDKLTEQVNPVARVGSENINMATERLLEDVSQLPKTAQESGLPAFLDDMRRIRQEGLSFKGAKGLRERLTKLVGKRADTPEKMAYKQVKDALDLDIAQFADETGGDVEKAWRKANAFHGGIKELGNQIKDITTLAAKSPEKVVESVFRPGNVTSIRLLRKAMPESGFNNLRKGFVSKLFDGNGPAYDNLAKNIAKYGDDTLQAALPKETISRLQDFSELTRRVGVAEKMAGNPSGTGQTLITQTTVGGVIGYVLRGNPVAAVTTILTPPTLAKMYLSDVGRKLITEGFKLAPGAPRAAGIAAALSALAAKREFQEKPPEPVKAPAAPAQDAAKPGPSAKFPVVAEREVGAYVNNAPVGSKFQFPGNSNVYKVVPKKKREDMNDEQRDMYNKAQRTSAPIRTKTFAIAV